MSGTLRTHHRDESDDVLLIDDEQDDIRLARAAFDSAASDTALRVVTSREDALAALRQQGEYEEARIPELVLLDPELEGNDGFDVLRTIRDDPELRPLPVIVLTHATASEDIARSYEANANAYLTKPTEPDEFADVVAAIERFWLQQVQLPPVSQ